jgi:hypothetical protein
MVSRLAANHKSQIENRKSQMSTSLDVLIGTRGGPLADLCPVRFVIASTTTGNRSLIDPPNGRR